MRGRKSGTALSSRADIKIASCLVLVAIADMLFYGQPAGAAPGWTLGLFGFLLLLTGAIYNHKSILTHPLAASAYLAAAVLSAALIEAASFYTLALFILTICALALLIRNPWIADARRLLAGALCNLCLIETLLLLAIFLKKYRRRPHAKRSSLTRIWLMPCAFLACFLFLFAEANPILDLWLSRIDWTDIAAFFSPARAFFWVMVAAWSWPLIRPKRILNRRPRSIEVPKEPLSVIEFLFNRRSVKTALITFNLLFALQNGMDIAVLWSGVGLPERVSYASYAHQGAYPLIFTAVLAGTFVLVALRPGSETEYVRPIRALVCLWVGQNIFLVLSSSVRLKGYVGEFSLTYLRVAAFVWMGLVALGLALILLRILRHKSNLWLINANAAALYLALILCTFTNFDGIIAEYNVRHCREITGAGSSLDLEYLYGLGVEAVPALLWYKDHGGTVNYEFAYRLASLRGEVAASTSDWRSWTFRLYRLKRALEALGDAPLAQAPLPANNERN